MSEHNVFNLPIYGKPITLDDAGVYYAVNRKSGSITRRRRLFNDSSSNIDRFISYPVNEKYCAMDECE